MIITHTVTIAADFENEKTSANGNNGSYYISSNIKSESVILDDKSDNSDSDSNYDRESDSSDSDTSYDSDNTLPTVYFSRDAPAPKQKKIKKANQKPNNKKDQPVEKLPVATIMEMETTIMEIDTTIDIDSKTLESSSTSTLDVEYKNRELLNNPAVKSLSAPQQTILMSGFNTSNLDNTNPRHKLLSDTILHSDTKKIEELANEMPPDNTNSVNTMIRSKTNLVQNQIHSRVTSSRSYGDSENEEHIWAQYGYSYGKKSPEQTSYGFNVNAHTYTISLDTLINNNTLVGIAYSISNCHTKNRRLSKNDTKQSGHTITLYAAWTEGKLNTNGQLSYSFDKNKACRYFNNDTCKTQYNTHSFHISLYGSYTHDIGKTNTLHLTPFLTLNGSYIACNKYSEHVSGVSLSQSHYKQVKTDAYNLLELGFGTTATRDFILNDENTIFSPHVSISYSQNLSNKVDLTARFVNDNTSFTIPTSKVETDRYCIKLGGTISYQEAFSFVAKYSYHWTTLTDLHGFTL